MIIGIFLFIQLFCHSAVFEDLHFAVEHSAFLVGALGVEADVLNRRFDRVKHHKDNALDVIVIVRGKNIPADIILELGVKVGSVSSVAHIIGDESVVLVSAVGEGEHIVVLTAVVDHKVKNPHRNSKDISAVEYKLVADKVHYPREHILGNQLHKVELVVKILIKTAS